MPKITERELAPEAVDTLQENYIKCCTDMTEQSINVAKNKHASQSGTWKSPWTGNNYIASWANDGNPSPYWWHRSVSITGWMNSPFWIVNLGREYEIKKVVVYNRSYNEHKSKYMKVEIFNQDQLVEFKQKGGGNPGMKMEFIFSTATNPPTTKFPIGDKVKISIPNKYTSLEMAEVEVWNKFYA